MTHPIPAAPGLLEVMTPRHTPGPWTQCDLVVVVCPPSHEYSTWIVNAAVGGHCKAEQLANARLIAAAPELLEALRDILADGIHSDVVPHLHRKARAAISKATGEAA